MLIGLLFETAFQKRRDWARGRRISNGTVQRRRRARLRPEALEPRRMLTHADLISSDCSSGQEAVCCGCGGSPCCCQDGACGYEHSVESIHACAVFAPGTPMDVVERFHEHVHFDTADLGSTDSPSDFNLANRWTSTATNGTASRLQGDPVTLTWSIIPDGTTTINGSNGGSSGKPSNLIARLDQIYGSGSEAVLENKAWFSVFETVYERWSAVSGIEFVYEANDDGALQSNGNSGVLGVRGDMRVGGHSVDGNFGVLAYNYYPNLGEMVIDTTDSFYEDIGNFSLKMRNVLAHELGHGLGVEHVMPTNQTKLMEPFASVAFDGPQFDDVLAVHRAYGDQYEESGGNDSAGLATDLGAVSNGGTLVIGADAADARVLPADVDFVSIDGATDVDFFKFQVSAAGTVSLTLTPHGPTYDQGEQGGAAPTSFVSAAQNNLDLTLYGPDGTTAIATASAGGLGATESLVGVSLATAGTYYVRVKGVEDAAQLYQLDINFTGNAPEIEVLDGVVNIVDGSGTVSFGSTSFGSPVTRTFTVRNTGTADLTVQPATVPAGFSITANLGANALISPGNSRTFIVRLDADAAGTYGGEISFANTDGDENPFNFTISGTVTPSPEPEIQVLDGSVDIPDGTGQISFGATTVGNELTKTFTVKNNGTADLTLQPVVVPSGFTVTSNFVANTVLQAGNSTTFVVRLDAAGAGQYGGVLSFGNDDNDENPFDFAVSGTVVVAPEIQVLDGSVDIVDGSGVISFGSTLAGSPITRRFTVNNLGTSGLTVQPVAVPAGFTVTANFSADTVIPAGGSSSFDVRLNATAVGSYGGMVSFQNTDSDENPFNFTVSGAVSEPPAPEIEVLDGGASLADGIGVVGLGTTVIGTPVSKAFTVNNVGTSDLVVQPVTVPAGFTVTSNLTAGSVISAGGSASFDVQLDATVVGSYSGTLSFANNDSDEDPFDFTISGTVDPPPAPEIEVRVGATGVADGSGSVDFGIIPIGGFLSRVFTVANVGNLDLVVQPVSVPVGFTVVNDFTAGQVIASGGNATFEIRYDAVGVGRVGGTVSFANSDADENPFDFTIAAEAYRPPAVQIVDDGGAGFSATAGWSLGVKSGLYSDHLYSRPGNGAAKANWSFAVSPGRYRVSATWKGERNRATDSPFTVFDGANPFPTVPVNQEQNPDDLTDFAWKWEDIGGPYDITGTSLRVSLSDAANQYVIADAVRIERLGDVPTPAPEIRVFEGSTELQDGLGSVDFGRTRPGISVSKTFTVENVGNTDLTLQPVTVPSGFTVTSNFSPGQVIAAGGSGTFVVRLDGVNGGIYSGSLAFMNSDGDESPFDFTIQGTVGQPPAIQVIDDGDSGFVTAGRWGTGTRSGFQQDHRYSAAGDGSDTATWTFSVTPGEYRVSASWTGGRNRATDAPFTVTDGANPLATVLKNQKQKPDDFSGVGLSWEDLGGTYAITGTTLRVSLSNAANQYVIADAVRVERVGELPLAAAEVQVFDGLTEIVDGSGSVDFGSTPAGSPVSKTFTVKNNGDQGLTVQPVLVPAGFSVTSNLAANTVIPAGGSAVFVVRLDAVSDGQFSGSLQFANSDSDENPFDFTISGVVADPPPVQVIDDGDSGFVATGGWGTGTRSGYQGDHRYSAAGGGAATATWTFTVTPGEYRVSATWKGGRNRATNSPFMVADGANDFPVVRVNQEQAPDDFAADGLKWKSLGGPYTITGTTLVVTLTDAANQYVIADAVRVERLGNPPGPAAEVQVFEGSTEILDGVGSVDFGSTAAGSPVTKTFTVRNNGGQGLTVQPVTVPSGFSVTSDLPAGSVIPAGGTALFAVRLDAVTDGAYSGMVQFANSDSDENPFDFAITGRVADPPAIQIIDDGGAGFVTTGAWGVGTRSGFQGDHRFSSPGSGAATATWTFDVAPGQYRVSASWKGGLNRATNSPFTISDGGNPFATVFVDQKQTPNDLIAGGLNWEDLGSSYTITGMTLVVTLSNAANQYVIADAIRIERLGP